jgi:CBS domain-containing protein
MAQKDLKVCKSSVVVVAPTTTVAKAAALMREHHVGTVVIVEKRDGKQIPTGILTDRDIVIEVVAPGLDADLLNVGEVVQRPLVTVGQDASSSQVVREMTLHGVRRMPVVHEDGSLAGIVCLDDVLLHLVAPLVCVSDLAGRQPWFEARTRTT